jgi:translocation protein SEC72
MLAVIDASYQPVDVALGPPENVAALCSAHSSEKCTECGIDFVALNRISKLLLINPNLRCPPPAQMVTQKLSQMITATKEEGNVS